MTTDGSWEECFVDADHGLAFFDGLTIEADPINDPRHDRVFPIFKKEQVFMCRQMDLLFRDWSRAGDAGQPPLLALDIGTGSGVLAIWAAKHGCKVYALDVSQRAIEFARHNADVNDVRIHEFTDWHTFDAACEPGIWFQQKRFDDLFVNALLDDRQVPSDGCFDLMMLNPPYNPTFEGVVPALHANGGSDGQEEFRRQIQLVPRLLRNNGYCVGHQMGVRKAGAEHPNIVTEIEEAFRQCNEVVADEGDQQSEAKPRVVCGATGKYVKVLDNDRPVKDFLKAQYSTYLAVEKHKVRVERYINKVASDWGFFSLLYFQFQKHQVDSRQRPVVTILADPDPKGRPVQNVHRSASGWTWETREWLHRCIVEHAGSVITVPWPSLFTDHVVSEQMVSSLSAVDGDPWARSAMRLVDQWIAELPPRRRPPFDFVHIESVPFTPYLGRLSGLRQESAVWLSLDAIGGVVSKEAEAEGKMLARRWLAYWTTCVQTLNEQLLAPFLHPVYLGSGFAPDGSEANVPAVRSHSREWNPLMHSFLRHGVEEYPQVRPPSERGRDKHLDERYDARDGQFAKKRREVSIEIAKKVARLVDTKDYRCEWGQAVNLQPTFRYIFGYDTEALGALGVDLVDEYRAECEARIKKIGKDGDVDDPRNWKDDLEYCHATLHGIAAQAFPTLLPGPLKWSHFLSVPLDLSDPLSGHDQAGQARSFRGSIFLFFGSFRSAWSPRQDRLMLDLARFATLLYNGRFNVEESERTGRQATDEATDEARRVLAHQVKVTGFMASRSWLVSLNRWEAIKARFAADDTLRARLTEARVAPVPGLYDALASKLMLWSLSYKPDDLFSVRVDRPPDYLPARLSDLAGLAWEYGRRSEFVSNSLNLNFTSSNQSVEAAWKYEPPGDQALACAELESWRIGRDKFTGPGGQLSLEGEAETSFRQLSGILRALVVAVENFLTHAPVDARMEIHVEDGVNTAGARCLYLVCTNVVDGQHTKAVRGSATSAKGHEGFRGLDIIRYLCQTFLDQRYDVPNPPKEGEPFLLRIPIGVPNWLERKP